MQDKKEYLMSRLLIESGKHIDKRKLQIFRSFKRHCKCRLAWGFPVNEQLLFVEDW